VPKGRNPIPLATVLVSNVILAVSQTNIASVFLPISETFHQTVYGLGILSSVFFVGYFVFEVPSNVYGVRLGPRGLATFGAAIAAAALFACALAPSFDLLVVFRLLVGAGYGIFFPSAIVLAMRNAGEGSAGFGIALMTAAFSIGGALGVASWSLLSSDFGWRVSLLFEGAITTAAAASLRLLTERETGSGSQISSSFRRVLSNRKVLILGLCFFGSAVSATTTGSFIVYYLEEVFGLGPGIASLAAGVDYITLVFSGFLAGRMFDRGFNGKLLVFGSALALTIGTVVIGVHSVYAAYLGSVSVGLSVGFLSTIVFALSGRVSPVREDDNMALAVVDSFSLGGLLVGPLVFPPLVVAFGYPPAWAALSVFSVLFALPVLLSREVSR